VLWSPESPGNDANPTQIEAYRERIERFKAKTFSSFQPNITCENASLDVKHTSLRRNALRQYEPTKRPGRSASRRCASLLLVRVRSCEPSGGSSPTHPWYLESWTRLQSRITDQPEPADYDMVFPAVCGPAEAHRDGKRRHRSTSWKSLFTTKRVSLTHSSSEHTGDRASALDESYGIL
jgi:hypothetical protein